MTVQGDASATSFPRPGSSEILSRGRPGSPPHDELPHIQGGSVLESPREADWMMSPEKLMSGNPSLMMAESEHEFRPSMSAQGPASFFGEEDSDAKMRAYEQQLGQLQAKADREYSFEAEFRPDSQASDRSGSKKKSREGASRGKAPKRGGSATSKTPSRTGKGGAPKQQKEEMTIEERLDVQLQQIMKSKSKLAIAMERVSADMHIKKRDRELMKLKRDMAQGIQINHAQREEIIRLGEDAKEKDEKMEELKKRNFKLLTKQRKFDEMKLKVGSMETPEDQGDMETRIKKEIMSKVERSILELKHNKSELQKEVKLEKATNHKANLVISELERELTDVKENCAAAEDQVRYVMDQDKKNVARLNEVEAALKTVSEERNRQDVAYKSEVETRLSLEVVAKSREEQIIELEQEKATAEENMKELALQIADLDNTKSNADRILFEQSKKHAMAAEKVVSLQKEVQALEVALKAKNDDAEEETIMARDAVVSKLQNELTKARQGKEDIEVALGRLVATQEEKQMEWDEDKKNMEEAMEKALRKVEKLPALQSQLSAALQEKERLAIECAEVTGKWRVLEEGKSAADIAIHKRGEMEAQIKEQLEKIGQLTKSMRDAEDLTAQLKQQVGDLQLESENISKELATAAEEKEAMLTRMEEKDAAVNKARKELEEQLTNQELSASEMTGMKFQCEDLQKKLKVEREAAATARSAGERDQELAKAAQTEAKRLTEEKQELGEELDALKIQMRAMMTNRRPSSFTEEDLDGCKVIFEHIRNNKLKEAEELLATGMPADLTDAANFTPLMIACQCGARKLVKALLRRGASLNLQNQHGDTALHCCMPDHEELGKYLVSKGADEELRNNNGKKWTDIKQAA